MRYLRDRLPIRWLEPAIAVAVLITCASVPCGASPIQLWCPWTSGQYAKAGGWGSYYYEGWHVGDDKYAIDFNKCTSSGGWLDDCGHLVRAAAGGTVHTIEWTAGMGWKVYLRHNSGGAAYYTLYGHLQNDPRQDPGIQEGDHISHGAIIGKIGDTGSNSDGCHLHFVLYGSNWVSIKPSPMSGQTLYTNEAGKILRSNNVTDDTCPRIVLDADPVPASGWYNTSETVSWSISDGESGFDHAKRWWGSGSRVSIGATGSTPIVEGDHTFHIKAWDEADNGCEYQPPPRFRLDVHKPTIDVDSPDECPTWYNTPQQVSWSVSDAVTGVNAVSGVAWVQVQWDAGVIKTVGASGRTSVPYDAGHPTQCHTLKIRAADKAGNATAWLSYGPFGVDAQAPVIDPYDAPEERTWFNTPQVISWVITGSTSQTLQWIPGGTESVESTGTTAIPEGVSIAKLRATDQAKNVDVEAGEYWIDFHAPNYVSGSMATPPESGSLDTLSATWQFADPVPDGVNRVSGVAEYEYWIGTTPGASDLFGPLSTQEPWAWATGLQLDEGSTYYFTVRARDAAGNWSEQATSDAIAATIGPNDAAFLINSGGTSATGRTSGAATLLDSLGQFAVGESVCELGWAEHGYWHSDIVPAAVVSTADSRLLDDESPVVLGLAEQPVVVTAPTSAFIQRVYVEDTNRASGIAVEYSGPTLLEGDQVWVKGKMKTVDHERVVGNVEAWVTGHIDPPLAPFALTTRALGGLDSNDLTSDIPGSVGPYNVGLLVKIVGRITAVDPLGRFFYFDDGPGLADGELVNGVPAKGIRVSLENLASGNHIGLPLEPSTVFSVTGVVSVYQGGGQLRAQIRPRTQSDLTILGYY